MQPRLIRDMSVVEYLENHIKAIPLEKRIGSKIEFAISEKLLQDNLRAIYDLAIQRLLHLTYYLECSRKLSDNKDFRPEHFLKGESLDYVHFTPHHFEQMGEDVFAFYNNSLADWINRQVLRDLNEFLSVYLKQIHEFYIGFEYSMNGLRPQDIVDIKSACKKFEGDGLKERLATLRKKLGLSLTHNQEIIGLAPVRNILSHHDGMIDKNHCNKDGYLEVSWLQNTSKIKRAGSEEWTPYHRRTIGKRGTQGQYAKDIKIKWLGKREIRRYMPQDIIMLSSRDMNDISFMYLYAFNELHGQLVNKVSGAGLQVTPFSEYMIKPETLDMFGPDKAPEDHPS